MFEPKEQFHVTDSVILYFSYLIMSAHYITLRLVPSLRMLFGQRTFTEGLQRVLVQVNVTQGSLSGEPGTGILMVPAGFSLLGNVGEMWVMKYFQETTGNSNS